MSAITISRLGTEPQKTQGLTVETSALKSLYGGQMDKGVSF